MLVPQIRPGNVNDPNLIKNALIDLPENKIEQVNWPDLYPSKPLVSFKIAHNGSHLFFLFSVFFIFTKISFLSSTS